MTSFPLRERGLKRDKDDDVTGVPRVVPLAGTWIETSVLFACSNVNHGRSPCGNVD